MAGDDDVATRRFAAYVMPLIATVLLVIGVVDVGPQLRARLGEGRPGTFIVWSVDCLRFRCAYYGHFASDDGTKVLDDVRFLDAVPDGTTIGTRLRAQDTGGWSVVYAETGSVPNWFMLALATCGGLYLLGWMCWLLGRVTRPLRRRIS
jgi:hypothetical protein